MNEGICEAGVGISRCLCDPNTYTKVGAESNAQSLTISPTTDHTLMGPPGLLPAADRIYTPVGSMAYLGYDGDFCESECARG